MALSKEVRMTIKTLWKRSCSRRAIARAVGVTERQVRYELGREAGKRDGRAWQRQRASGLEGVIQEWCGGFAEGRALNATALHEYLVSEHGYVGSRRSVQRYLRRCMGPGRVRARAAGRDPAGGAIAGGLGALPADVGWRSAGGVRVRAALELLAEERGGVVGAEEHAVVVVGSRGGVSAGEGGDGDGADRQREDGDGAGSGGMGGCEPGVFAICGGGAVSH